jgi:alkaline phosphatase
MLIACVSAAQAQTPSPTTGSVIFIHPDGASAATWEAARARWVGPDGELHWDRLPRVAVYKGHLTDNLTATSNAGATIHATGQKAWHDAFGLDRGGDDGKPILDAQGRPMSVARQAVHAGIPVGLVNSGVHVEPGTACFLVEATARSDYDDIIRKLVESGAQVLLGAGETDFLPKGVMGRHGKEGTRSDGKSMIDAAIERGYTVVYNREELLNLPSDTKKVLGIFAARSSFNDRSEEENRAAGCPLYEPQAPTLAEMTAVTIEVLRRSHPRFLLVIEEEGTDNFGNHNNAEGVLEAARRADEAIGVARAHLADNPQTLILTCADSDAGGMRMVGFDWSDQIGGPKTVPPRDFNGAPMDGQGGTGGAPFVAQPDHAGRTLTFGIAWASRNDVSGGVVLRGEGFNSHLITGTMDNTDVAKLIQTVLLGS